MNLFDTKEIHLCYDEKRVRRLLRGPILLPLRFSSFNINLKYPGMYSFGTEDGETRLVVPSTVLGIKCPNLTVPEKRNEEPISCLFFLVTRHTIYLWLYSNFSQSAGSSVWLLRLFRWELTNCNVKVLGSSSLWVFLWFNSMSFYFLHFRIRGNLIWKSKY